MKKSKIAVEVLNIRLSKQMVSWLDSIVDKGIYKSRSEAVRDFIRQFLSEAMRND